MKKENSIPEHIAIIMDGNGRWANSRGLPRIVGHASGAKTVDIIVEAAAESGIKFLTLYAFSSENWKRSKQEIDALFRLLEEHLVKFEPKLKNNNIRLMAIGNIAGLPQSTRDALSGVIASTSACAGMTLVLALNYGARTEIADAARRIAAEALSGRISPERVDENVFKSFLYTSGMPDPDLLIRTSGEFRLSNFLLWQIAYSEICIVKKYWPDFTKEDFAQCVIDYQKRERRFGG